MPAPHPASPGAAALLEVRGVCKRFGSLAAVSDVSFAVQAGEIVALLGENGAGKTTLLRLLAGRLAPDAGEIHVEGRLVTPGRPAAAEAAGLGLVPQHAQLAGPLSVADNAVLGREPRRFGLVYDRARAEREVGAVGGRQRLGVDPSALARDLTVSAQQRAEIVKALWRGARILALDEPTSSLAPAEVDGLFAVLRELAAAGTAVLLVTHKLAEVRRVAQRLLVLRRGELAAQLDAAAPDAAIAEAMAGGKPPVAPDTVPVPHVQLLSGFPSCAGTVSGATGLHQSQGKRDLALSIERLTLPGVDGMSLAVGRGEIFGLAGVDGNGQRELCEAIAGARPARAGRVHLAGHDVTAASVAARRALGLRYVPEDRLRGGLCPGLTLAENLDLCRAAPVPRSHAAQALEAGDVRPGRPGALVSELSGGNQQKLLLARELAGTPAAVIAAQPTRGLDRTATAAAHARLRALAAGGTSVVVLSTDLDELRALCDRIAVLYRGRIADEMPAGEATDQRLSAAMLGRPEAAR